MLRDGQLRTGASALLDIIMRSTRAGHQDVFNIVASSRSSSQLDVTTTSTIFDPLAFVAFSLQVPCSLVFNLAPTIGAAAGLQFPMMLDPAAMTIPPASAAMLAVPFMPTAMGRFAAMLEGVVQLPGKPGAKPEAAAAAVAKLQICKLSGEGGLPSLLIELPKGFEEAGQINTLRFSKLLKVSSMPPCPA